MPIIPITIDQIFDGMTQNKYFSPKNAYGRSIGVDLDMPVTDSEKLPSGLIRPTSMELLSSTTITAAPMWIETNPKDSLAYIYDASGKVYTVDASYTVSPLNSSVALTTASGNGIGYYDNYMYFAKGADVCRYGPLNGSPTFTQSYWVSTLSQTALTNTTYPTIRGVSIPNHPMHRHVDDKLYFGDVTSGGKGIISYIKTTKGSVEGDTNSGSSYNALDMDQGYYPTAIETYGNDLAIAGIEGVSTTVRQKPAFLTFWDTTSPTFTKLIQVEFPDPLITAMKNVNGTLYVWSGSSQGGCRLSAFLGSYSFQEIWYDADSYPPFQGAVDAVMNRVVWGGVTTIPSSSVSVFAYGSRLAQGGKGIHNILKTTSAGANGSITALKYFIQHGFAVQSPMVGWKDDSAQGLDKRSTTYGASTFTTQIYRMGQPFDIKRIYIPLAQAIAANQTLTVTCYADNGTKSQVQQVINNTNFPESTKNFVELHPTLNGDSDFYLKFDFSGTSLMTVALPITITVETYE